MSSALVPETATQRPAASSAATPQVVPSAGLRASAAAMPLVLLSLAHGTVDLYSSIIATLQPLFVERYTLSLTQVGIIGGVFMFSSSVMQLFFGVAADRFHTRMFAVLSPAIAAVFLSSLLHASGFQMLLLLTFLGGLGVAAFHPSSTKEASAAGGQRRGLAVAIFVSCGTFGLSLGPAYFSTVIEWAGAESLSWAAIPGLAVSAILFWKLPSPGHTADGKRSGVDYTLLKAHWKPLALHYALVVLRSIVQVGMIQFLAIYLYSERGFTFRETSLALTVCLFSAAAGSFLGGGLAERIGGPKVMVVSMAGATPFLALFVATTGWISLLSLFIGGTFLLLTIPVIVVMAQELIPSQAATVSGLMMGFAWGMAGMIFVPLIGWTADRVGLEPVFWVLALLPLAGLLLSLKIMRLAPAAAQA